MRAVAAGDKLPMVCEYMRMKTGVEFDPAMSQGFAILADSGEFVAAVLVSNVREYNGKPIDCEMSCAAESAVAWRDEVLQVVFNYVFKQLGCVRVTAITKKSNVKSRKFLEHLNFELEGNVRKGYDGEKDALFYGLLAENCRFLGVLSGQEVET